MPGQSVSDFMDVFKYGSRFRENAIKEVFV